MDCTECREILSARLDGESTPGEDARADRHLAGCVACRAFADGAAALHRSIRLVPATPVPDLTAAILAATAREPRPAAPDRLLRGILALAGLAQLGLALPALLLGDDAGLPVHMARHLGSFTVALAIGFLFVAWRPHRFATGFLPMALALVGCLAASSILDIADGATAPLTETHHLPELVGVLLVWLLARPARLRRPARA